MALAETRLALEHLFARLPALRPAGAPRRHVVTGSATARIAAVARAVRPVAIAR